MARPRETCGDLQAVRAYKSAYKWPFLCPFALLPLAAWRNSSRRVRVLSLESRPTLRRANVSIGTCVYVGMFRVLGTSTAAVLHHHSSTAAVLVHNNRCMAGEANCLGVKNSRVICCKRNFLLTREGKTPPTWHLIEEDSFCLTLWTPKDSHKREAIGIRICSKGGTKCIDYQYKTTAVSSII